jgi:hypothetical protein
MRDHDKAPAGILVIITGEASLRYVYLFIRTGGDKRLSDTLLWECACAELHAAASIRGVPQCAFS